MTPILGVWASQSIKNFLNVLKFAVFSPTLGQALTPSILLSSNGVDWSGTSVSGVAPSGFYNSVVHVPSVGYFAHSGKYLPAYLDVPDNLPNAGMMKSTDGLTWTTSGVNWHGEKNAVGLASNGGTTFIAPTDGSNGVVKRSTNYGYSWDDIWEFGYNANSVAYGNGKFVITGYNWNYSGIYSTSTDGINWNTVDSLEPFGTNYHVKYVPAAGMFFMFAPYSSTLWFSSDAILWGQVTVPFQDGWSDIDYLNGTYVLIAGGQGSSVTIFSTSLYEGWSVNYLPFYSSWSSVTNDGIDFYAFSAGYYGGVGRGAKFDSGTGSWVRADLGVSGSWSSTAKNLTGNEFVAVQFYSEYDPKVGPTNGGIYYKKKTPASSSFSGTTVLNSFSANPFFGSDMVSWEMVYGNGKYAIAYPGDSNFFVSTNGLAWTKGPEYPEAATFGRAYNIGQIIFANGKFVLSPSNSYYVYSSTDLTSWTVGQSNITGFDNSSIIYGNGKYVRSDALGQIETSTDAVTWSGGPMNLPSDTNWSKLGFTGTQFFIAENYGNRIATSTNGIMWSVNSYENFQSNTYTEAYYLNGRYIFNTPYNNGNNFVYSTNFVNWEPVSVNPDFNFKTGKIIYHENKYYAMSYYEYGATNVIKTSTDLVTWTDINLPISGAFSTIIAF